ncbi:UvrB/UvrC motif-containing protein [Duganella guangzhouensis]|uniref:UvrB/UvrC motif-containing protein n=1 Tax=Duganella guangzhouensis TaxID=2666084 RepID=UPI0018A24620|nr:UvrB/UvrC motif-containing protein [Duganella guangzhouensis]
MSMTIGRIDRAGTITFGDASLNIYEEGISAARAAGGYPEEKRWCRAFKREVFARIVQTLNRLGWICAMPEVCEHDVKHYGGNVARWSAESKRLCQKGDLHADLNISGRCIQLDFFQNVNAPDRPDNGGRYQHDKEKHMPYVMWLEMERARRRIRTYLLNVLSGYTFKPSSPKLGIDGATALEYAKHSQRTSGHYVERLGRASFNSPEDGFTGDGVAIEDGSKVYAITSAGRVVYGSAYYSLNGRWMVVTGTHGIEWAYHKELYSECPGDPRVKRNARQRRSRLEGEMAKAIKALNFERAGALRDILFPGNPALFAIYHTGHELYHRVGACGYTSDLSQAGKFTADEVAGWDRAPNKVIALNSQTVTTKVAALAVETPP